MSFFISGKTRHAPQFRRLRDEFGWPIQARWLDKGDLDESGYATLWEEIIEDIRGSQGVFLVQPDPAVNMQACLIEVGVALQLGLPVVPFISNGAWCASWTYHPNVKPFLHGLPAQLFDDLFDPEKGEAARDRVCRQLQNARLIDI